MGSSGALCWASHFFEKIGQEGLMTEVVCNIDFEDLRKVLFSIPAETEREFLKQGDCLRELSQKAREILSLSGSVGGLLGVEDSPGSNGSMVSFVEIANLL